MRLILILLILSGCAAKTKAIVAPPPQNQTIDYRKDSNLKIIKEPEALNKLQPKQKVAAKARNNISTQSKSHYANERAAQDKTHNKYTTHQEWVKKMTPPTLNNKTKQDLPKVIIQHNYQLKK